MPKEPTLPHHLHSGNIDSCQLKVPDGSKDKPSLLRQHISFYLLYKNPLRAVFQQKGTYCHQIVILFERFQHTILCSSLWKSNFLYFQESCESCFHIHKTLSVQPGCFSTCINLMEFPQLDVLLLYFSLLENSSPSHY